MRTYHSENPKELIQRLETLAERSDGGRWIYRGHADSTWELVPKVHRQYELGKLLKNLWNKSLTDQTSSQMVICTEGALLHSFAAIAERRGLYIPGQLAEEICRTVDWTDWVGKYSSKWLPRGLEALAALAQHYGVPTRLLDWSRYPKVAAHFACRDAAVERKSSGTIAVYALDTRSLPHEGIHLVRSPSFHNHHLVAQGGLFTVHRHDMEAKIRAGFPQHTEESQIPAEKVEEMVLAVLGSPYRPASLDQTLPDEAIVELTIDASQAPKLMWLLRAAGVGSETVFPGYTGAAIAALDWHSQKEDESPELQLDELLK